MSGIQENYGENNKSWMYQWLNEDFLDTLYNYENIIVADASWNATNSNEADVSTKLSETTIVTTPVGLLNSYEYYKSYQNSSSSNGYLNIGYYWWLLNPYSNLYIWRVGSDGGDFYVTPSDNARGVRPSVYLQSGITISGGLGTSDSPYTILGDKESAISNTTLLNTRSSGEYVNFDGELYRIVSIQNNVTKLNKIDYIKDENDTVIAKNFSNSTIYGNGDSDIYWDYYLNNTWYNSIALNYKNMLVEGTYYLGTVNEDDGYKIAICQVASNIVTTSECEKTNSVWTGYVGLPRYGEMFATQYENEQFWSDNIWVITPYSNLNVWTLYGDSRAFAFPFSNYTYAVRPSITLNSAVKITDGLGTKESPFEISL